MFILVDLVRPRLVMVLVVDHDKILQNLVAVEARVAETQERIAQFKGVVRSK